MDEAAEAEVISVTLPHEARFLSVARIVVGGLAARLDLPFESLDDLQLAVETVLSEERYRAAEEVSVEIAVEGRALAVRIGPLDVERLEADLHGGADDGFGFGVMLGAVVDAYGFDRREADGWLRLEKQIPPRLGG